MPINERARTLGTFGLKATTVLGSEDMPAKQSQGARVRTHELVRANLHLAAEAHRLLSVHVFISGRSAGDLVSELISLHLRSWGLPADRTGRIDCGKNSDRLELGGDVNLAAGETAA